MQQFFHFSATPVHPTSGVFTRPAHARLVVIGGDSFRLHEEIIATGGFIKDQKWGTRLNVGQTETALAGALAKEPSAAVKGKLLELYPSLTSSLGRRTFNRSCSPPKNRNALTVTKTPCEQGPGRSPKKSNERQRRSGHASPTHKPACSP